MRITIDRDRCEGHGLCAVQAPAVLDLNDDAEPVYAFGGSGVPAEHLSAARAAVRSCPVAALSASD
ncbi:ferredoxin [Streptomyces sp. NPDC101175]|uniref:ferredoxin n=1 Tax=Streptomyces sp. NPDC101175 TaxID=3366123 RepID=UPI003836F0A3